MTSGNGHLDFPVLDVNLCSVMGICKQNKKSPFANVSHCTQLVIYVYVSNGAGKGKCQGHRLNIY